MYLYFQIGISGLVMYCSVVLMMAQKDAVSQLMNLTALWTLNNFDNFTYLVFDMVVMKNVKHRSILLDDKFMKFKVTENQIGAAIAWIEGQFILLLLYYAINFFNQFNICDDVEGYLSGKTLGWDPNTKL